MTDETKKSPAGNAFWGIVLFCLCSLAGGQFSHAVMKPRVHFAGTHHDTVAFTDAAGRGRLDFGLQSGEPLSNFTGADGDVRLQMGMYAGDVWAGEKDLPFLLLANNTGHLRMLYRVTPPNQSPTIIMKDQNGNDRIVMGLNLQDKDEEPFLALTGSDGKQHMMFGEFHL